MTRSPHILEAAGTKSYFGEISSPAAMCYILRLESDRRLLGLGYLSTALVFQLWLCRLRDSCRFSRSVCGLFPTLCMGLFHLNASLLLAHVPVLAPLCTQKPKSVRGVPTAVGSCHSTPEPHQSDSTPECPSRASAENTWKVPQEYQECAPKCVMIAHAQSTAAE